jgi:hypothetical protein
MSQPEIEELAEKVREAVISSDMGTESLRESKDSVNKKLIFLVPFSKVDKIGGLIAHFEEYFPHIQVDVEMNSLEDAYVKMVENEAVIRFAQD